MKGREYLLTSRVCDMTHNDIAAAGLIPSRLSGASEDAVLVASSHKGNSRTLRSSSIIVEYVGVSAVNVRDATSAMHSIEKRMFHVPTKRAR